VFTHEMKPYEVEILVAQVGVRPEDDELFHILYDGTVMDEEGHTVLGGEAERIAEMLEARYEAGLSVTDAIKLGASVLGETDGEPLSPEQLEVAVLQRGAPGRAFRRIKGDELGRILAG
jgi:proteasome alpha subunit